ncbi:nucleotidyltransferase domain-containing protein [Micromonospora sp. NPDC007271]|uniref:nucleotidyltransferase domain-containing protein n=1 Tax=Micromonospora sp. NPDC007271 TaxID=3154587 RepID=UPI0033CB8E1F
MKRDNALRLVEQMLRNLDAGHAQPPLDIVTKVYVFGSFARGALTPHDIDLNVELAPDLDFAAGAVSDLGHGRDPYRHIRHALVGRSRQCQFQFDATDKMRRSGLDFTLRLLWQRGDAIDAALTRLHAITADPTAGRAARDWMLPEFDGLDRWIPGPVRKPIYQAVEANVLHIERLDLADCDVRDAEAKLALDDQWKPGGDTHRAATAAVAYYERRGIPTGQIRIQRTKLGPGTPNYFVSIRWRNFDAIPRKLTADTGAEWLEILRIGTRGPLPALRLRPLDRQALAKIRWSTEG